MPIPRKPEPRPARTDDFYLAHEFIVTDDMGKDHLVKVSESTLVDTGVKYRRLLA